MTTVVYRLAGSISAGAAVAKAKGSVGRAHWISSIAKEIQIASPSRKRQSQHEVGYVRRIDKPHRNARHPESENSRTEIGTNARHLGDDSVRGVAMCALR